LPPLRDRVEDVPQIVDFFLQNLAKTKKTKARKVSPEALAILCRHHWPGNVRELENMIYRSAVIASGDAILPTDLPEELRLNQASAETPGGLEALLDQVYTQLSAREPATLLATITAAMIARGATRPAAVKAKKITTKK
jgi:two-component system nitrogen regulation response regulator GlnG